MEGPRRGGGEEAGQAAGEVDGDPAERRDHDDGAEHAGHDDRQPGGRAAATADRRRASRRRQG